MCVEQPNASASQDTLVLLQAVWRHGQRSPIGTFKGDFYPASYWRKGYGELTEKGCQQHFELGQWIRKRYVDELGFLPKEFDPNLVFVRCSHINRTIESAEQNFRGLYGNEANYRPPHFHTFQNVDCVHLPFRCCKKAKAALKGLNSKSQLKEYEDQYKDVLDMMSEAAGRKFTTFVDALFLTDPFTTQKHHGLKIPAQFDAVFDKIDCAHRDSLRNLYGYIGHTTPESVLTIRKAMASGLVAQITQNINDKIEGKTDKKYFVFSSHDTVVLALLATFEFDMLDYNQNYNVSLGASVFLELWRKSDGQHYIKVIYRRNPDELYDITGDIKDCAQFKHGIPLEQFLRRWQKYQQEHGPAICQDPVEAANETD